jgi:hypothetical protein
MGERTLDNGARTQQLMSSFKGMQTEVGLGRRLLDPSGVTARLAETIAFTRLPLAALQVQPVAVYLGQDGIRHQLGITEDLAEKSLSRRRELAANVLAQLGVAGFVDEDIAAKEIEVPARQDLRLKSRYTPINQTALSLFRMSPAVRGSGPGTLVKELGDVIDPLYMYAYDGLPEDLRKCRLGLHMGVVGSSDALGFVRAVPDLLGTSLGETLQFGPLEPVELVTAAMPASVRP